MVQNLIIGVVVVGVALYYIADGLDKKIQASSTEKSIEGAENLKTQEDLNEYAIYRASQLCDGWVEANNYKNETKRWEKQLYIDGQINDFELRQLDGVIQSNDLPNSYKNAAIKKFIEKVEQCGWNSNRSNWPGQSNH